ncbi:MAG: two pore domain potassium channel family protein [Gammaproteobacteria bacterium]|nr:two pore domain potassium channel family protein [Gammaproteobacteria bacterium]MCP4090480.1 two pore domain potassium channel family protein [Gammaproteobacteria bacterium]MCP4276655.1 two pore domain potassium channel family protein [Gammaproteobacteria bacterium]MCP4831405.1 two pore domain potassium channel family protein [Gammaproteobacteria bacterium]MCP4927949.1 two pore domain potassium channel family protein [Gammaproteobacteria bacterium]
MIFENFHIITMLVTMFIVIITVLSHYEGLRYFTNWMAATRLRPRLRIVIMIYGLLMLHTLEIWLFGISYWVLSGESGYGAITSETDIAGLLDYVYFSATVYSTLGFGDLLPTGPIRMIVGIESVTGLLLITWSASFTYLEMIQYWRKED